MDMERKQIYLRKNQSRELEKLSAALDANTSELIRRAVDRFVEEQKHNAEARKKHVRKVLREVAGIWKDRNPKEFEEIRRSADRRLDEWDA